MIIKPIKNEALYESALSRIYKLLQIEPKEGTRFADELEVLSLLVKEYEEKHYPMPPPNPLEAIRFRLDQMGMKPSELNKILGSRSRKSDIFSGKRKLTLSMIRALHEKLHIPAEILIAEY